MWTSYEHLEFESFSPDENYIWFLLFRTAELTGLVIEKQNLKIIKRNSV